MVGIDGYNLATGIVCGFVAGIFFWNSMIKSREKKVAEAKDLAQRTIPETVGDGKDETD